MLGAPLALRLVELGHRVTVATRTRRFADISAIRSVHRDLAAPGIAETMLRDLHPDWVVNCAAVTSVDECESGGLTERVNADWPRELGAATLSVGCRYLHISTDSVFGREPGDTPPEEGDARRPLNAYARQKMQAEDGSLEASEGRALVARTNFFGWSGHPERGFAAWALRELRAGHRVRGFADVFFNPLYVGDAIELLVNLLEKETQGLIHVLGAQCLSKYEFLRKLAGTFALDEALVKRGALRDAKLKAPRPFNTCLATKRLEAEIGHRPPTIDEGLARMRLEESSLGTKLAMLEPQPTQDPP